MSRDFFKQELFDHLARIGKAVGQGHRLVLLEYLAQGERTVESLAQLAGLSVANTSKHLQQLRQAGLVTARKAGLYVHYALGDPAVVTLLQVTRGIAERRIGEVEALVRGYLLAKDNMEPIPRKELLERIREGTVTVLDVRPAEEYAAGHLPKAFNIPLRELERRLHELPPGRDVVAYCRGAYCVLSFEAVARLREKGFAARRLEEGFPEWKLAEMPVEESEKETG
ncbi:ArsR/SmtB family transcription factor [Candidatus Magnetaquicoccus inordinatus]|uniref:ArsR/SmtB family transcription factor n=1 Tax=Candidatus Magnetaquicoccus inordinatus TaxID=2496818 RepID=UPI00102C7C8F|nr:metalloregulator ArsR/SmtB family transcription factor [Candidatus Magnetaquicoccus inordinatus]